MESQTQFLELEDSESETAHGEIQNSKLRNQNSGLRTQDSGLKTQDSGLKTQDCSLSRPFENHQSAIANADHDNDCNYVPGEESGLARRAARPYPTDPSATGWTLHKRYPLIAFLEELIGWSAIL